MGQKATTAARKKGATRRPAAVSEDAGTAARLRAGSELADLYLLPGFLLRRCRQLLQSMFVAECSAFGITPLQYAVMEVLSHLSGLNQRELAELAAIDLSTTAAIIPRLERLGIIVRSHKSRDRRSVVIDLTDAGRETLARMRPAVRRASERLMQPLPKRDRERLTSILAKLVERNDMFCHVPQSADMVAALKLKRALRSEYRP